jgi:phospholipid-binding lipoprotein MlaA
MNENTPKLPLIAAMTFVIMATLSGCAMKGNAPVNQAAPVAAADEFDLPPPNNNDPLECINRSIFEFNEVLDGLILKPAAHIYLGVVPSPVRKGVKNALTNLSAPVVFLNSAFQGDNNNMGRTFGRFLLNSTVGIAGIFDVASEMGLPKEHKKDFGQTLGVHGVAAGPYLVIPVLGPSGGRDVLGMLVDMASDPFTYILTTPTSVVLNTTRVIDRRADLLPLTDRIYRDSLDPYASIRSVYQQHREKVVYNYLSSDTNQVDSGKKK